LTRIKGERTVTLSETHAQAWEARMAVTSPSLESEYALIGAAMVSAEGQSKLLGLHKGDLSNYGCQTVFASVQRLSAQGTPPTPAAIATELAQRGELEDIGGTAFIFNLAESYDTAGAAGWHADAIRRDALIRKTLDVARIIQTQAAEPAADPERVVAAAVERLLDTTGCDLDDLAVSPQDMIEAMVEQAMLESEGSSLTWGLAPLDSHVQLLPGMLVYIGARPKVGKSSLLFQLLQRNCGLGGVRGCLVSYEMGQVETAQHLTAKVGYDLGVTLNDAKHGPFEGQCQVARSRVAKLDLTSFFDNPDMMTLASRVHAMHRVRPFGILGVDYVGKVADATSASRGIFMDNKQAAVSMISSHLKTLARQLGFVIVSAAQINRAGADEPGLHHLRDSGALEADADAVILLHQPEEDLEGISAFDLPVRDVKVKVAANRMGPASGWMTLTYEGRYGLFRNPGPALSVVGG
jgi:replicative DNA helicase